jgi:hypothetical protein
VDHSGGIAIGATTASYFIPGVNAVTIPRSLVAGGVSLYKDVRRGDYVAASFDALGVGGDGAAIGFKLAAKTWARTGRAAFPFAHYMEWANKEQALAIRRANRIAGASYATSLVYQAISDPTFASAAEIDGDC